MKESQGPEGFTKDDEVALYRVPYTYCRCTSRLIQMIGMASELTNELSARMDGTAEQQTFADDSSSPPEFCQRLYDVQHKLHDRC